MLLKLMLLISLEQTSNIPDFTLEHLFNKAMVLSLILAVSCQSW